MRTKTELRKRIDEIDSKLIDLLDERMSVALEVGRVKAAEGLPVHDPERERQLLRNLSRKSTALLAPRDIEAVFGRIMAVSCRIQEAARGETEGREDQTEGREDQTERREDETEGREDETEGREDETEGRENETKEPASA
jgi:chorismate mutase